MTDPIKMSALDPIAAPKLADSVPTVVAGSLKSWRTTLSSVLELFQSASANANTETLTGPRTLADSDETIQFLDPGGAAREVVLPSEANTNHPYIISNRADAEETLTVKNDGGDAIVEIGQSETKAVYSDGANWAALSGGGGSGGESGDIVAPLVNAEVSITGVVTLDSTAFDKMHVITGTSANYTITLPAVSGNAGKIIGFRVGAYASATKLYTLDGNSSETINGKTTRALHAGEAAILLCDGTEWKKIAGLTIPYVCELEWNEATDPTIAKNTITTLTLNNDVDDPYDMGNLANNRIDCIRGGDYTAFIGARYYTHTATRNYMLLDVNGGSVDADENSSNGAAMSKNISKPLKLVAGDYVSGRLFHNASADVKMYTSGGGTARPYLRLQEVPKW